jgi:hypothetical protein
MLFRATVCGWSLLNGGVKRLDTRPKDAVVGHLCWRLWRADADGFSPEQSVSNYLDHVVYSIGRIPLTVIALSVLRRRSAERAGSRATRYRS